MYQPSEIVLIPFPYTDLSSIKKRPILIIKPENSQSDFIALQVTSKAGYTNAFEINKSDFILGLLPKTSYVRVDKIFTLNHSIVIQRIGKLSDTAFSKIEKRLCEMLDC